MKTFMFTDPADATQALANYEAEAVGYALVATDAGTLLAFHGRPDGSVSISDADLDRLLPIADTVLCCHPQQVVAFMGRLFPALTEKVLLPEHFGPMYVERGPLGLRFEPV